MADVWRGVHPGQDVPVAVKVVTAAKAREPRYLASFRSEVRAVARLHHPGIILVFDHGEVDEEAERASGGRLTAGSPYLAMELASQGTLADLDLPVPFSSLVTCLLALLDALAHAHARGVLHRDLKPGNVLMGSPQDLRPGLKLTDFGLAHALDRWDSRDDKSHVTGTPIFMAPEQFRAAWRDFGPWTDLYALGCMAFLFSSARPPFVGNVTELASQHCRDHAPRVSLPEGYPAAFSSWVGRLLEKEPGRRFPTAADAAWSLVNVAWAWRHGQGLPGATPLGEREYTEPLGLRLPPAAPPPHEDVRWLASGELSLAATPRTGGGNLDLSGETLLVGNAGGSPGLDDDATVRIPELARAAPAPVVVPERTAPRGSTSSPVPGHPPIPPSWRRAGVTRPMPRLKGAGLGLYGLRAIPLVDRDQARDACWQALCDVHATGRAHLVLLRGPAGTGKSRLAEWVTERALELGVATFLRAVHAPRPGPGHGLPRMLLDRLQGVGLDRAGLATRAERFLDRLGVTEPYEWKALAELVAPAAGTDSPAVAEPTRIHTAAERHAVVRRTVAALGRERPVVAWLDDVQWGPDALAWAHHVMANRDSHPCRVLLLLTARDDALADLPAESAVLGRLERLPGSRTVEVAPLEPHHHRALVQELLGLDGQLTEQLASRTAGNPLFAVQLVGDWVQRGVLQAGDRGFQLALNDEAILPDDIHQVWSARLAQVTARAGPGARVALELAAVLGTHVDEQEWLSACLAARVFPPDALVDELLRQRLLVRDQGGFRFVHGMLRESAERAAAEEGRLVLHHRVAASVLQARAHAHDPVVAERLGRHLLEAGLLEESLDPLLAGARQRHQASEYGAAHLVLSLRDRAVTGLRLPDHDERVGLGWALRARICVEEGRYDDAMQYARWVREAGAHAGWKDALPDALVAAADVAYRRGDVALCREWCRQAQGLYTTAGNAAGVATALAGLGDADYHLGRFDDAGTSYQQALEVALACGDRAVEARSLWGLGYVHMWRGQFEEARACFQRQHAAQEILGSRFGMAQATNALAELARVSGELEEAERRYRESLAMVEAIGSTGRVTAHLNVALVLLERGHWEEVDAELRSVWDEMERGDDSAARVLAHAQALVLAVVAGDGKTCDDALGRIAGMLAEKQLRSADVATVLGMAATQAQSRGDAPRAQAAVELATSQWTAMGRPDKVIELKAAVLEAGMAR
jgi:tetratricopeptide (TPR) repeat protein